jgi:glycosyltransferase involved in cell wall biosynthesis
VQSTHAFANIYVGALARALSTLGVGVLRSSLPLCAAANGAWTPWLFRAPEIVLTNSVTAERELLERGWKRRDSVFWIPNAIDLSGFDRASAASVRPERAGATAAVVGRLVPVKRVERFVWALAAASKTSPRLKGLVVGDGPERAKLAALASRLGLSPRRLHFAGERWDVPALLASADMLALCADSEGFPNAVMEAMAARLPVVTTPAGDAPRLVEEGVNGFVVPFDDDDAFAERLSRLAEDAGLRRRMGEAGRRAIEQGFTLDALAARLFEVYRKSAERRGRREILRALPSGAVA